MDQFMNNRFLILTPSYNNEQWVEYNLASVLNQTYTNWKCVYINDNSTDNTLEKVRSVVGNNPNYTIINNEVNRGATYNYFENSNYIEDNDIVIHLDGDDWLIDETVLERLNNLYNETDCWMTYGGMVAWDGVNTHIAHPQNTQYTDFVHEHKYYKRDMWRASHLRTYRGFFFKSLDKKVLKTLKTNEYYWHASDLAFQYAYMEMCGKERIQVVDFFTYVYNQDASIAQRTRQREASDNHQYEVEIRNRKTYKTGLGSDTLPLINVIGDFRERNSIPTKFSLVYGQLYGEFDITLIQDYDCVKYINGEYGKLPGMVIADLHEAPHLFNHQVVYEAVKNNADKFDYIFTYSNELLTLPNAIFRNGGYECVLNKNIHSHEHPLLADESLFNLYEKSKGISFITSNKNFTDLHKFRNHCVSVIISNNTSVDIYGMGHNTIKGKIDGLKDYKYSIAIENGVFENYFTEKILDCFLTGTIPIYKGCPNISKFFNSEGIITFDTVEDLLQVIDKVQKNDYNISKDIIEENYTKAMSFCYNNDRFFDKYISPLINKNMETSI